LSTLTFHVLMNMHTYTKRTPLSTYSKQYIKKEFNIDIKLLCTYFGLAQFYNLIKPNLLYNITMFEYTIFQSEQREPECDRVLNSYNTRPAYLYLL